jgi:hypothetical protein
MGINAIIHYCSLTYRLSWHDSKSVKTQKTGPPKHRLCNHKPNPQQPWQGYLACHLSSLDSLILIVAASAAAAAVATCHGSKILDCLAPSPQAQGKPQWSRVVAVALVWVRVDVMEWWLLGGQKEGVRIVFCSSRGGCGRYERSQSADLGLVHRSSLLLDPVQGRSVCIHGRTSAAAAAAVAAASSNCCAHYGWVRVVESVSSVGGRVVG